MSQKRVASRPGVAVSESPSSAALAQLDRASAFESEGFDALTEQKRRRAAIRRNSERLGAEYAAGVLTLEQADAEARAFILAGVRS